MRTTPLRKYRKYTDSFVRCTVKNKHSGLSVYTQSDIGFVSALRRVRISDRARDRALGRQWVWVYDQAWRYLSIECA